MPDSPLTDRSAPSRFCAGRAESDGADRTAGTENRTSERAGVPLHHPADGPPPPASRGEDLAAPIPTRATPRQATSAVAHVTPPPEEDDPLLAFAPYIHTAPRRNSITPDLQRRFVATLAVTGIVKQAARSIGRSMEALYKLRARPGAQGFAAAWDEALRWGVDRLEDCALERALNGGFDGDPVSGWGGRGNGLLIYLLSLRRSFRFDERDIVPGHPLYERIRAEVLAEAQADRARLRAITAKLPPHSSP